MCCACAEGASEAAAAQKTMKWSFSRKRVKRSHKGHGVNCGSACVRPQGGVPVWRQTAAQLQLDPSVPEERGGDPPGPGDAT